MLSCSAVVLSVEWNDNIINEVKTEVKTEVKNWSENWSEKRTLDRHLEPYISRSTFLIRITLTMLKNYSLIINLKSSKHVKMLGEEGKVSINEKMCCSDIQTKSKLGNSRMTQ